jgi:hypothetical protein
VMRRTKKEDSLTTPLTPLLYAEMYMPVRSRARYANAAVGPE